MEEQRQFGHFRLLELIGRGGMGEVWRALDTRKDREVALKLLLPHLLDDVQLAARFRQESEVVARLSEPHVIPIHDYGELDGRLFLEMRLVVGGGLDALIAREAVLPPSRAVRIVGQVASALDAAHAAGLVHRDVKPSNVLIVPTGNPREPDFAYLVDFGIARLVDSRGLTGTGMAVGTPAFMAPEQFEGRAIDPRADVYSLGCLLFVCLTGRQPFTGDGLVKMMFGHLNTPVPRVSAVHPGIAQVFDDVIGRAMAKRPGDRYRTAGELADAAMTALSAPVRHGGPGPVPAQIHRPTPPGPRNPTTPRPAFPPVTSRPVSPRPVAPPGVSPRPVQARPPAGRPSVPSWQPPSPHPAGLAYAAPQAPQIPRDVRIAFRFWIAGGLLLWAPLAVILVVAALLPASTYTTIGAADVVSFLWVSALVCVAMLAAAIYLPILMRRGKNWARWTLAVLGSVVPLLLVVGNVASPAPVFVLVYTVVLVGLTSAGLFFMFRPQVGPYFRQ